MINILVDYPYFFSLMTMKTLHAELYHEKDHGVPKNTYKLDMPSGE